MGKVRTRKWNTTSKTDNSVQPIIQTNAQPKWKNKKWNNTQTTRKKPTTEHNRIANNINNS